jgi:hypothetical protein
LVPKTERILQPHDPNRFVSLYELQAQKQAPDVIKHYIPRAVIEKLRSITIKASKQLHSIDLCVLFRALRFAKTGKETTRPRRDFGIHKDLERCCLGAQLREIPRRLLESSGVGIQASRDFVARISKS